MKIKELPDAEKPRERLAFYGPSSLTDSQILAVLLRNGYHEKNVTATYLHGPLLSKNPKLADSIISYCMTRKLGTKYTPAPINAKLENECREVLLKRLLG